MANGSASTPFSRRVAMGALFGLTLAACSRTRRPDGHEGLLPVGSHAPDFTATTGDGKKVNLSSVPGWKIVYFYPKDETPGCTKEACAFRDAFQRYQAASATIFGVSRDSEESHRKFREHHALPFPLAADESGAIQKAYGVPSRLGIMAARTTFVVNAANEVTRVFENVDPAVHADEVLSALK